MKGLRTMKGICFLCGNYEQLEEHHIFGGARRPISTKYGLTVHLCPWCHRIDADSAHRSGKTAELLHKYGQHKAMVEQKWSKEEFIAHFGKNYLDEAQIWGIEHPDDSWDNESAFQLVEEGAVLPF